LRIVAVDRVFGVPGVAQMRATYRWSAVTRLVLIALAALAVESLLRRPRKRAVAVGVAVLAVVELIPNVPLPLSEYREHHRSRTTFDAAVISELRASTHRGETVFFLSPDDVYNDYLVNYLAATVRVRALNAGGDKNSELAQSAWPSSVAELARPDAGRAEAIRALKTGP
jgi:hypothetical protein